MSFEIIVIMLLASCMHATWNVVIKSGTNQVYEAGLNTMGGGVGIVCVLPFLPLPVAAAWMHLAGSMFFHAMYYLSVAAAYRQAEMSYVYTLMRGIAPLFTAFGMLFLGQPITNAGWLGILGICAGVLVLACQNLFSRTCNRGGTLAALFTAVVITCYTINDGFGVRVTDSEMQATSYVCWLYFLNAFPVNLLILSRKGKDYLHYVAHRWKIGLFGGLCNIGAYGVALWAMTRAPIELVASLRSTSVVFGMLMAVIFLGEKFTIVRFCAVVLVAVGTIVMRLA